MTAQEILEGVCERRAKALSNPDWKSIDPNDLWWAVQAIAEHLRDLEAQRRTVERALSGAFNFALLDAANQEIIEQMKAKQ
jgi:hypothetical protein